MVHAMNTLDGIATPGRRSAPEPPDDDFLAAAIRWSLALMAALIAIGAVGLYYRLAA